MKFEEAIQKLEAILSQLRSGQMPLEELTAKIKEAKELVDICKKSLAETSEQVEKLIN